MVLGWLKQDVDLREHELLCGDRRDQSNARHRGFEAALIDGSEFTERAELDGVYGARFLLLDDTEAFEN